MTIGPATVLAIIACTLATLVWGGARKLGAPDWLALALFGLALVLVATAGPLLRLP